MAIIFYWKNSGLVYGVHPDLATAPKLPDGVEHIEVAETPDKIAWPVPLGQAVGKEAWTVVDTTTTPPTLKINSALSIAADPDLEFADVVEKAETLEALKKALVQKYRVPKKKQP